MKNILVSVLQDNIVLKYLLKHESIIQEYFSVPAGVSPNNHVLSLANNAKDELSTTSEYTLFPLYCTTISTCSYCHEKLSIKKALNASLYDDVLGTKKIAILTKYCTQCKVTYYPGFSENYLTKKRIFEEFWEKYGIFTSTFSSAFSLDFLERSVCLKLKCHTTFVGRTEAFNLQHKYQNAETEKLDKRVMANAYYKYTLICFKKRYSLPLILDMDINNTLNNELSQMQDLFLSRASCHVCSVAGCSHCIVVDGHMKSHRKICNHKGCIDDPTYKSEYCDAHLQSRKLRQVVDNAQVLVSENEYHVEKILRTITKNKKRLYEVKWIGYSDTTLEPKENIPRVLTEVFDKYGDSSISTSVKSTFEKSGVKYIVLNVHDREDMILPACSLQIDDNAYFIPIPNKSTYDCNTQKTKSRFYHRTGGILAMGRPCGYIVCIAEIFGGESISQVADLLEVFLENLQNSLDTKCVVYDDGCHLKRSVDNKHVQYPHLSNKEIKIDRFHFGNHIEKWCKDNMNPDNSDHLKNVNTEVMEQTFAWLKGYAPALRYMKRVNYLFLLLDMIDRHNMEISLQVSNR